MRSYKQEAQAVTQTPEGQNRAPFADAITAALVASASLVILSTGASYLLWRAPWWELSLAAGLVPVLVLAAGMMRLLARSMLWHVESTTGADLDGDGIAGEPERIRLVPVNRRVIVHGCDREDLAHFVRVALQTRDWTQNSWRGKRMPSGRRCDNRYHAALVGALVTAGIVQDYRRGSSGHLAITDAADALQRLGL